MKKRYNTYILPKPFYWAKLKRIAESYKIDKELLLEFFKNIYTYTIVCLMSHEEFQSYDAYERDSFLDSLSYSLIEDYCEGNDQDYAEYYEEFVNQVLWAKWFGKLLRTINEEIEVEDWRVKDIDERRKNILITYVKK